MKKAKVSHMGLPGVSRPLPIAVQGNSSMLPGPFEEILHHFIGTLFLRRPNDLLATSFWSSSKEPADVEESPSWPLQQKQGRGSNMRVLIGCALKSGENLVFWLQLSGFEAPSLHQDQESHVCKRQHFMGPCRPVLTLVWTVTFFYNIQTSWQWNRSF